jgi:hypothetical protein
MTMSNSQHCEQFFGQMRAQSTMGYFGRNFTPKKAVEIVNNSQIRQRLQSQLNDTFHFEGSGKDKPVPFEIQTPWD